jgi:chromosome segregation ATPase
MDAEGAGEDAGLLLRQVGAVEIALPRGGFPVDPDRLLLMGRRQRVDERMLRGDDQVGDAVQRVGAGRVDAEDVAAGLGRVGDGKLTSFDGDLDDYRALLGGRKPREAAAPAAKPSERRDRAESRASLAPLRERVRKLEAEIAKLEAEAKTIDTALADPRLYANGKTDLVARATTRRGEIAHRLPRLEAEWLELQEKLEAA